MGVTETLVDADPDGRLIPSLSTNWTVSEDGLSWNFDLREGAFFHDGTAFTPEIVVNALKIA